MFITLYIASTSIDMVLISFFDTEMPAARGPFVLKIVNLVNLLQLTEEKRFVNLLIKEMPADLR